MTVMRKENDVVKSNQDLSLDTLVLTDIELPIRPGYGNDGKKIVLKTNYFRMKIDPSKSLFKYEVKIDSNKGQKRRVEGDEKTEAIGSRVRQRAFALLFGASDFRSLGDGLATDFAKTIITTRRLELGAKDSKIYQVVYREAEETVPRPNPTTYTFRVSFEGSLPIDNLLNHPTTTDSADFPGKADAIQALNIVIARSPNNDPNIFQAGQNKFFHYPTDQKDYLDLTGGLIAVRGFYSSVRCSTMRTLLNLNSQCSPFYPAVNMCNLMDQHCKWVEDKWQALNSFIDKLRVKIQYLKNKDGTPDVRVKTVVGLSHKFGEVTNSTTGIVQRYGNAEHDHGDSTQLSFECSEFPQDGLITIDKYFHKSKTHLFWDSQKLTQSQSITSD